MQEGEVRGSSPFVLFIPLETMDQLRARRLKRKFALPTSGDRPVLSTIDLLKRAGKFNSEDATKAFCDDMTRLQVEVEDEYDAFLLDPGIGPMTYITSDGRILFDSRTWDGEGIRFATNLIEVVPALVIGAKKTDMPALLDLIPPFEKGVECSTCGGSRWFQFGTGEIVCPTCSGRGQVFIDVIE